MTCFFFCGPCCGSGKYGCRHQYIFSVRADPSLGELDGLRELAAIQVRVMGKDFFCHIPKLSKAGFCTDEKAQC